MWKKICDTISDITDSDIFDKVKLVIISAAYIIWVLFFATLYGIAFFILAKVLISIATGQLSLPYVQ